MYKFKWKMAQITMTETALSFWGDLFWWIKSLVRNERVDFRMKYNQDDPFDAKFQSRTFAPELVLALRQILHKRDWVVDAGAQKGYITLHAAKLVGLAGRVFAFEPDPRSREILEVNCALNSLSNVIIIGSALGAHPGVRSIMLSSQLGWTSFYPNDRNRHTTIGAQQIIISRMDDEIIPKLIGKEARRLAMVKIDCEGSEPEILKGMTGLLTKFSPLIWVEINTGSLTSAGSSEQALLNLLWEKQYETFLPRVGWSRFGVRALSISPYKGGGNDGSHRVFDVLACRKSDTNRLMGCGVLFEE